MGALELFDVAGRVAVVTGGSGGIGFAISGGLASAGATVVIADILGDQARQAAETVRARGGKASAVPVDVTKRESVQQMVSAALAEFGKIDVLVNCAGILHRRPIEEVPDEEWDAMMNVNLRGIFLCCRAVVPHMREKAYGKIVNISSSRVWEGVPNRLHYTTSKAGVIGLTRALCKEVGEYGITVNAITPGYTLSETQQQTSSNNYLAMQSEGRAMGRAQYPEDLVGAVMFLSSSASDYMTGQTMNVDGGKAMH